MAWNGKIKKLYYCEICNKQLDRKCPTMKCRGCGKIGTRMPDSLRKKLNSPEVRAKISASLKGQISPTKGKTGGTNCSKGVPRPQQSRENHWNWRGGITKESRLVRISIAYKNWRDSVFKRDNWECQSCKHRGGILHPHHIKEFALYPTLRLNVSNGVTYCEPCHRTVHYFRTRINKIINPTFKCSNPDFPPH